MKAFIKKNIPGLYDYYLHLGRKKKIRETRKLKKLSLIECARKDAQIYEELMGHKLNWNKLETYTEKMQWEKLFDQNPLKVRLTDKYEVREWVKEQIGEEYLIPLLGTWERLDDVNFEQLPEQFVLKTNHGSGTNVIVRDKSKMNVRRVKRLIEDWLKIDYAYHSGFEMHYSQIKPRIIAEQYVEAENGELQDYKFLCFHGEVYYCWVDQGRYSKHVRNVYDLDWNLQPWNQSHCGNAERPIAKPENFDLMVELAHQLCQGFSHVRVDLYNVRGKIYFGEMTFTNGRGFDPIVPQEYDKTLGNLWIAEMAVPEELTEH